jgi:hypothetical protein
MVTSSPGRVPLFAVFALVLLEHDPEKWVPVFRKDHAQIKEIERDDDSKKRHPALGGVLRRRLAHRKIQEPRGVVADEFPDGGARHLQIEQNLRDAAEAIVRTL